MYLEMFSIRDSKGECFNTPFFQKTAGEAERNFKELTRDPKSMVSKYPEDYDLYRIGRWDDQEGKLQPLDTPQHIVKAIQLIDRSGGSVQ